MLGHVLGLLLAVVVVLAASWPMFRWANQPNPPLRWWWQRKPDECGPGCEACAQNRAAIGGQLPPRW